mgnify:CR=1 FL=1
MSSEKPVFGRLASLFSSVKVRLIAAFTIVSALTVCAAAVSYIAFNNVSVSLQVVTEEAAPAISNALRLSEASKEIAAAIPTLTAAANGRQLSTAANNLARSEADLGTQMDLVEASTDDRAAVDRLRGLGGEISGRLGELNKQMSLRLALQDKRLALTQQIAGMHKELLNQLGPIIDQANNDLVAKSESTMAGASKSWQKLSEVDMVNLRVILQFQASANLAFALLREGMSANNVEDLQPVEERFEAVVAKLSEAVGELAEGGEIRDTLEISFMFIQSFGSDEDNVFHSRRMELEATGADKAIWRGRRIATLSDIQTTHSELLLSTEPLVDDANFNAILAVEDTSETLNTAFGNLINVEMTKLRGMLELKAVANEIAGLLLQATAAVSPKQAKALNLRFDGLAAMMAKGTENLPKNDAGKRAMDLTAQLQGLGRGKGGVFALRTAELGIDREIAATMAQSRALATNLGGEVNGLVEGAETILENASAASERAIDNGTMALSIITLVSLAIAVLIGWLYINRSVSARLVRTAAVMERLADGDLSVEIATGGSDEISAMARAVGVFKENALEKQRIEAEREDLKQRAEADRRKAMLDLAQTFEETVLGIVEAVTSASTEMETTAQSMLGIADQNVANSETVAAESEHAANNVSSVAAATEQLTRSVDEIAEQAEQSNQISQAAVSEAQSATAEVEGLAKTVAHIDSVVELISDIANQTNLLALNATIEAARAGDAGKGFAVVASEVKNLANQTADATEEIAGQIKAIQSATGSAVMVIDGVSKTIGNMNGIAATIAAAVVEQGSATAEISRNVGEATESTTEVNTNVTKIKSGALESRNASDQLLSAASELSQQSVHLKGEVDKFLAGVRAG